jgi:hypothetical protein
MPDTAARLGQTLGLSADASRDLSLPWGAAFGAGHRTSEPATLFPRVELAVS